MECLIIRSRLDVDDATTGAEKEKIMKGEIVNKVSEKEAENGLRQDGENGGRSRD